MSQTMQETDTRTSVLGEPLKLPCGTTIPNRIVKAAMTEQLSDKENRPSDGLIRLYERWGKGGTGVLLTGNVMVDRRSLEGPRNVAIEDDRDMAMLKRWAEISQANGSQLWMQISHPGRQIFSGVSKHVVAPSAIKVKGWGPIIAKPREITESEILDVIARFAHTAEVAREAGFSGVQIHSAHGYLNSAFLSPLANLREDDWGGTPEKRMRFLLENVRATRKAVGADFPISVKLNSADFQRGGFDEEDSMDVVRALDAEGVDLLEISGGNYENPMMMNTREIYPTQRESTVAREGYFLEYAQMVRKITDMPLMLTGGLRTVATMTKIIEDGDVDCVGLARPLALDPDFSRKAIDGEIDGAFNPKVNIGIKLVDDLLQSLWYQEQLHLMAKGKNTNPGKSRLIALASGLYKLNR